MIFTVISQDWTGEGPRHLLLPGETVLIGFGTTVNATTGNAFELAIVGGTGAAIIVSSFARIEAFDAAVFFNDPTASNNALIVEESAVVFARSDAVTLSGENFRLENHGQITAGNYAVVTELASADHEGSIVNTGLIAGERVGITWSSAFSSGTIHLTNSGLIWGGSNSLEAGRDTVYLITNRGELRGDVILSDLADRLDNVGGLVVGDITMAGGDDVLRPGTGVELVDGGGGTDLLDFTASGAVRVSLANGTANTGAAKGDSFTGFEDITGSRSGADWLEGNGQSNRLIGLGGNDRLDGKVGGDDHFGGAGNDTYVVDDINDRVFETATALSSVDLGGTDTVLASRTWTLAQFFENLTLTGTGNTIAEGNTLRNSLTGNAGNNSLSGFLGNDTLKGGAGEDRFVFNTALSAANIDQITDFAAGTDEIQLENAVFAGLAAGALADSRFVSNTTGNATTGSQRVIYESDTGKLFYDADGAGSGAAVQFATLGRGMALTHADFFVI